MKITLQQLWDAQIESLGTLCNAKQANVKASYWIGKVGKKLVAEIKDLTESRNELIKKHGEEKDGNVSVAKDKTKAFSEEFKELLKTEIEVAIEPIPFEYVEAIQLSPADFINLDWLIAEPVATPEKAS